MRCRVHPISTYACAGMRTFGVACDVNVAAGCLARPPTQRIAMRHVALEDAWGRHGIHFCLRPWKSPGTFHPMQVRAQWHITLGLNTIVQH